MGDRSSDQSGSSRRAPPRSRQGRASVARGAGHPPGVKLKKVAKCKARTYVADRSTGPNAAALTILSAENEAIVVAFRRHALLPLDDCLYALRPSSLHLTRSTLHRCLQRHGLPRLAKLDDDRSVRRKFKRYPLGYFHIDIAEVWTA